MKMNDIFVCPKHGEVADKYWGEVAGVPSYCTIQEGDKICGLDLKFISGSKKEMCSKCGSVISTPKNRDEIDSAINEIKKEIV